MPGKYGAKSPPSQAAGSPPEDVPDPVGRHDLRPVAPAPVRDELPDEGEVAEGRAHAAGGPGRPEAVDGDVRIGGRPHRPPQKLTIEIGVAPSGGPLDHPPEEVGVGGDVVERPSVRAIRLGDAPEPEPDRAARRTAMGDGDSTPTGGTVHPTRVGFSHKQRQPVDRGQGAVDRGSRVAPRPSVGHQRRFLADAGSPLPRAARAPGVRRPSCPWAPWLDELPVRQLMAAVRVPQANCAGSGRA